MKSLASLMTATALICGPALAQIYPSDPPTPSPSQTKLSPNEVKADCITAAKKAGLNGDALDDYVKQCLSRAGTH